MKKTSFWKIMLASMVGFILANVVISLIFIGSIGTLISKAGKPEPVEIKDKSVLKMEFSMPIPDRTPQNPFESFNFDPYDMKKVIGLNDILRGLEKAEKDENIKGIFLDVNVVSSGMASLNEVRGAIEDFKESGKWVVCYTDIMSQKALYLGSVADEVYINPEGSLDFRGLSASVMYFKNALDKLGIEPQIFRHGKFKAAVEPFMTDEMSEANRMQTLAYTTSMWNTMLEKISASRNISVDKLNMYADSLMVTDAQSAVDLGLIDGIKYKDEILENINLKMGEDKDDKVNFITMGKYKRSSSKKIKTKEFSENNIAVVFAEGNIVVGKGDEQSIGGERVSKTLREIRLDDDIDALVLRVNSPGGSGLASEKMWREISLIKKEKPVVVSMGNYAASGGYYISCAADYIYAQPNTITGSIGVFGLMFTAEELLEEKIGITVHTVNTNQHADMGNIAREWKDPEKQHIQNMVERFYDVFITRVADGRDMTKEEVDEIGQGRVWTGKKALELDLVDELGGLAMAVDKAASLADISNPRIIEYPKPKDFMEEFLKEFSVNAQKSILEEIPGVNSDYIEKIKTVSELDEGVQARLPMEVEFE